MLRRRSAVAGPLGSQDFIVAVSRAQLHIVHMRPWHSCVSFKTIMDLYRHTRKRTRTPKRHAAGTPRAPHGLTGTQAHGHAARKTTGTTTTTAAATAAAAAAAAPAPPPAAAAPPPATASAAPISNECSYCYHC